MFRYSSWSGLTFKFAESVEELSSVAVTTVEELSSVAVSAST